MKNAGLFVILFLGRKVFEKSTCFLLAGLSKRWTFVITNSKPYKNSPCILSLNMHGLFVTLDFVCDERVFIFWIVINAL